MPLFKRKNTAAPVAPVAAQSPSIWDKPVGMHGPDLPTNKGMERNPFTGRHDTLEGARAEHAESSRRDILTSKAANAVGGGARGADVRRTMASYNASPVSGKTAYQAKTEQKNGSSFGLPFAKRNGGGPSSNESAVGAIMAAQAQPVPDRGSNPNRVVDFR
jgi:hypothetical protein